MPFDRQRVSGPPPMHKSSRTIDVIGSSDFSVRDTRRPLPVLEFQETEQKPDMYDVILLYFKHDFSGILTYP